MKEMLDGMQLLMEGTPEFDPVFYNDLTTCLNNHNARALATNDRLWSGTLEYAQSHGDQIVNDIWPECQDLPSVRF